MKLAEALKECTLALLRRIAASHGVRAGDELLRAELASAIHDRLTAPGYLEQYLADLTPADLEPLGTVRDQGWTAKGFLLDRLYPRRHDEAMPSEPGAIPILSLIHMGLLYRGFAPVGSWRGEVYYVPEELQAVIGVLLPEAMPDAPLNMRAVEDPDRVDERDAAYDVFCLLSFFRRGDRRLQGDNLGKPDLARLEQEAYPAAGLEQREKWDDRWRFLVHLCQSGGWVLKRGSVLKPARSASRLLAGRGREVQSRLLERYLRDRSWSDLKEAGKVRQLGSRPIDETAARQILLHHLQSVASSGWTDEDAFCDSLRNSNPDLLREGYASPEWSVVDIASGVELSGPASWEPVEGGWVRYLLRGPLHWLGVVRWGWSEGGKAIGFQYLAVQDQPEDAIVGPPESVVRILDRQDLSARIDGDLALLYRLEPYLELRRRGKDSSYRLARDSALAGIDTGGSWAELKESLDLAIGGGISSDLRTKLEAWEEEYGRYLLDSALLLIAATPEDADALRGVAGVAHCLEARVGVRSYRVVPERLWELVKRLKDAGHHPRVAPTVKLEAARASAGDVSLLKESLFAMRVLRSIQPGIEMEAGAEAIRRIESALEPEDAREVGRRVQEAVKRLQQRSLERLIEP